MAPDDLAGFAARLDRRSYFHHALPHLAGIPAPGGRAAPVLHFIPLVLTSLHRSAARPIHPRLHSPNATRPEGHTRGKRAAEQAHGIDANQSATAACARRALPKLDGGSGVSHHPSGKAGPAHLDQPAATQHRRPPGQCLAPVAPDDPATAQIVR
jgi:hypothetical protein